MKIFNLVLLILFLSCKNQTQHYVCRPCDRSCDLLAFETAGKCPHCGMELILESELKQEPLILNEVTLNEGSGKFLIEGGKGKKDKSIVVFYHKPRNFHLNSKILLVIPGAGRNADSYRDTWIDEAEKNAVLILTPQYTAEEYPFEAYHLCGLIQNINLAQSIDYVENTNMVKIDESLLTYTLNPKHEEWIFKDFDRIFDLATAATGSSQKKYDIFGHSAGGQILHRFALFGKSSKVDRILAANSGFYTMPTFEFELPFGLKDTSLKEHDLQNAFEKKLIILVGELDNQTETRGTLLRSLTADKQGLHRFERAHYFYYQAEALAHTKQFDYNWTLEIVTNVGHDQRKMAKAATLILYE